MYCFGTHDETLRTEQADSYIRLQQCIFSRHHLPALWLYNLRSHVLQHVHCMADAHARLMRLYLTQALLEGLESGHVGGAGLDVHWVEPADPSEPIYRHPRVVATPHTGTATVDLIDMYAEYIAENIAAVREGGPLRNQLLPGKRLQIAVSSANPEGIMDIEVGQVGRGH